MNFKAIEAAIREEINNPEKYYMPNSPALFVKSRLQNQQLAEEAVWFWNTYCARKSFNIEAIDALMPALNKLNEKERMPEWGTLGT